MAGHERGAPSMKPEHIIFDFDGTLVDSAPAILAGFDAALKRASLAPAVPLSSDLIGPPLRETLARLTASEDPDLLDALANDFKAFYDEEGLRLTRAYDGIAALLSRLAADGMPLHLATNKRWRPTERLLGLLGWDVAFASAYAQDKGPQPFANKAAMLKTLLSEQAIDPRAALYVGDTPADGEAAGANGLFFVAAEWGYGNFAGCEANGRWVRIPSPDALLGAIGLDRG
jgi:phosphoglycolate phosphatase